jgi:hypothetical protein
MKKIIKHYPMTCQLIVIRESMITALYNSILFSVFRDLDSKNQRCTKCVQYERTLAKLKNENQELQDRYCISPYDNKSASHWIYHYIYMCFNNQHYHKSANIMYNQCTRKATLHAQYITSHSLPLLLLCTSM